MYKIIAIVMLFLPFTSCKKEGNKASSTNYEGETLPQYDNTSFGIYKGYMFKLLTIDPSPNNQIASGNIKIAINNGNNIVKAYISVKDNANNIVKDTLTCTTPIIAGQNISNALFVGTVSTFKFSVNADGSNSFITFFIFNSKYYQSKVAHETSTQKIEVFEGEFNSTSLPYNPSDKGLISFFKKGDSAKWTNTFIWGGSYEGNGSFNATNFTLSNGSFQYTGAVNTTTNTFSGTWQPVATPPPGGPFLSYGVFSGIKTL